MNVATRVLIADDHPTFVKAVSLLLNAEPGVEVLGSASSGREAVRMALQHQPDVILMDLHMPALNGIEATAELHVAAPHIAVLVLTMFDDDESVFAAMRAGARGYILKGAGHGEIARAVNAVANGHVIFGTSIARRVADFFATSNRPSAAAFPQLTARETQVLDRLASGDANQSIAEEFGLTPKTVRNHVSSIFNKLQVASRAQAIVLAREAGLGRRPLP